MEEKKQVEVEKKRPKKIKVVTVEGKFPVLVSKYMYQYGRGWGNNTRMALRRAMDDLLAQPALRKKHITTINAQITVATVDAEEPAQPDAEKR